LIAPGDVFNTVRVETSKKRLENLGYFSKVELFRLIPKWKDAIPRHSGRRKADRFAQLRAGFSTVDSLIGFIELTQGNFDITKTGQASPEAGKSSVSGLQVEHSEKTSSLR